MADTPVRAAQSPNRAPWMAPRTAAQDTMNTTPRQVLFGPKMGRPPRVRPPSMGTARRAQRFFFTATMCKIPVSATGPASQKHCPISRPTASPGAQPIDVVDQIFDGLYPQHRLVVDLNAQSLLDHHHQLQP